MIISQRVSCVFKSFKQFIAISQACFLKTTKICDFIYLSIFFSFLWPYQFQLKDFIDKSNFFLNSEKWSFLQLQAVIDANIFPVLIEILGKAEFKTRKEAAWAITNATSGGTPDQIRYLVDQGCIGPLCDLLTVMDSKIVQVALNGLENILRLGDQDSKNHGGPNTYAVLIEECYGIFCSVCKMNNHLCNTLFWLISGLDKIEFLQSHENIDIYQKAFEIIQNYFGTDEEDVRVAPAVDSDQQQYHFSADQSVPMGGFHFWEKKIPFWIKLSAAKLLWLCGLTLIVH